MIITIPAFINTLSCILEFYQLQIYYIHFFWNAQPCISVFFLEYAHLMPLYFSGMRISVLPLKIKSLFRFLILQDEKRLLGKTLEALILLYSCLALIKCSMSIR